MSESRRQSVSLMAMPPGVLVNDSRANSTDDIQIALAPHIQTYLSQTGRRHSCCSVMLPVAFERAAAKSWLDPKFDSAVLEEQFQASVFPHVRMRYRFTLSYILLCSLAWCLYFVIDGGSEDFWRPISTSFSMMSLVTIMAMCFTHWDLYRQHRTLTSAVTALLMCSASLAFLTYTGRAFSPLGHFAICLEIILLIYTALPMPLWLSASIAICYSIAFELVSHMVIGQSAIHGGVGDSSGSSTNTDPSHKILMLRIMAHLSVHLVGVHVLVMNLVRMRGTFMKVGQNLLVRRQLEMEKQLKEKMIHSVMPPKVADMLLNEGGSAGLDAGGMPPESHYMRPRASNDVKSLFRPFHMHSMENVSILFADIVGFTRMSSTKTAEQLVEILNDLFERFDDLCTLSGCEKISTLGDCYYCVSGCPEPRVDHAICCVEMGLGMIDAMRCFDAQRHEGVKMRVGVHTGTVLCGIVGTRRVKFDVWSNDVSLANKMESSGKPEQVHISQETSNFLGDAYYLEEGEEVFGHRTYFVVGRRRDNSRANSLSPSMPLNGAGGSTLLLPGSHAAGVGGAASSSLSQSATNISVVQPNVPPASPVGQLSNSLNPSPVLSMRPRLTSLSMKLRKKSQSRERDLERGIHHPAAAGIPPVIVVRERPKIIITTKSLPGSLDSDEQQQQLAGLSPPATSTAAPAGPPTVAKIKSKVWRMPRFLKRGSSHSEKTRGEEREKMKLKNKEEQNYLFHSHLNHHAGDETLAFIEPTTGGMGNGNGNGVGVAGGYQQLPVLVESSGSSRLLDIPMAKPVLHHAATSTALASSVLRSPDGMGLGGASGGGGCCSPGQFSIYDDIIDVRSYISQSRSDISPFGRSGSYRSQCGRQSTSGAGSGGGAAATNTEQSPLPRPRASTLTTGRPTVSGTAAAAGSGGGGEASTSANANANANCSSLPPPPQPTHSRNSSIWPDGLSICPSATSRKDSGIKSNSRRSSIQQQIYALNQSAISQHRVSGYFTSSTSSISNLGEIGAGGIGMAVAGIGGHHLVQAPPPQPLIMMPPPSSQMADPLAACLQQLRKQSDLQLIRCVRDNAKSQRSYLVKPPLRGFSLYFKSRQLERDFRSKAHRFGTENETEGPPTLATPRYNTYIDIFVGIAVYLCISISLFLMTQNTVTPSFRLWVTLFSCFTGIQVFALFLFTRQMCRRHGSTIRLRSKSAASELIPETTSTNRPDGATGSGGEGGGGSGVGTSCADRIFEAISSWYPWHICLAVLMAMPVLLIIANFLLLDLEQLEAFEYHYGFLIFVCIVHFCNFTQLNCWMRNVLAFLAALCFIGIAVSQLTVYSSRSGGLEDGEDDGSSQESSSSSSSFINEEMKWFHDYHVEIYLDLLLILVLVWFLNREFEIGYRLTFYGNAVANQDKVRVQNMKNQADMLLHNIIPKHVAEHLKNTAKYSENHHNIAIIFASIVNFNEMYDESYLGGKEFLRVLNELIGDFDELLSRPEFRAVEKIKTIGSTFMAASGLDPSHRGTGNEHIHTLMEFSIAMQEVVDAFNKDLLEFNLILRIGMNIGDVTAGVIGTSKLYYDIWGDAVNVASRMDSTGVPNRIQVGSDCLQFLNAHYEFEPRGKVYVKGKDHMEVFLYTGRRQIQLADGIDAVVDNPIAEQDVNGETNETTNMKENNEGNEDEDEDEGDLHSSETTTLVKSQNSLQANGNVQDEEEARDGTINVNPTQMET